MPSKLDPRKIQGSPTSLPTAARRTMLLVIDNYDSFTWNLVQMLGEEGADPVVIRNDQHTVREIRDLKPDRVVISPGPCTPEESGVSVDVIRELGREVPLLGVCLGHQAVGEAFGGRTIRAARVMHGKTTPVRHSGQGLFRGLPDPLTVARYHSLVTDPSALPHELEVVAWAGGRRDSPTEVHAVRHRTFPVWGLQFHPESLFSHSGRELLAAFLRL